MKKPAKPAKKTGKKARPKPREGVDRPYCNGQWSTNRFRSFIISALRRAQWPPRHTAVARAFTRKGINPETGKPCSLHRCEACLKEFPKGQMQADHLEEVIPIHHNWADGETFLTYNWNQVIQRLFVPEEGYQILCTKCHDLLTTHEKGLRALAKKPSGLEGES